MIFNEVSTGSSSSPEVVFTPSSLTTSHDELWADLSLDGINWNVHTASEEDKSLISSCFEDFTRFISTSRDEVEDLHTKYELDSSSLNLACGLLDYMVHQHAAKGVLKAVLPEFQRHFLESTDVHSLTLRLPASARSSFLDSYYSALDLNQYSPYSPCSAVLKTNEESGKNVFAIFGGQGSSNHSCFDELRNVYTTYSALLRDFINEASNVLKHLSSLPGPADFFEDDGFDICQWLADPETVPTKSRIASAPFSFPLIGLLSLAHFHVSCKVLGKTPGQLRDAFKGVTGHSQGVVVAAAVARSTDLTSFFESTRMALEILFWIGLESHQSMPASWLTSSQINESISRGEGPPSPMLSVRGLDVAGIRKLLQQTNMHLPEKDHAYLTLINSADNFVIGGSPKTLCAINDKLRNLKAKPDSDQSRVVFNKRSPILKHQFLPMSAPFHCPILRAAVPRILEALSLLSFHPDDLNVTLYHTGTGIDLKQSNQSDLIEPLVRMVTDDIVDWPKASKFPGASHVVDFGPGQICGLVQKSKEGMGVRVISASELDPRSQDIGGKAELFSPFLSSAAPDWDESFKPRLFKSSTGFQVQTKMTRLLGTPPVMVAGMTPTTIHWDFVAAIIQAGYHAELALGGYNDPENLELAIQKLASNIPTKRGITCNIIYASPKSLAWQIPLIRRMVQRGYPINGLTVGAGVPSLEIVKEYIDTLGLKHISFKPGSYNSILQVLTIAKAHPHFPIGLQWTGGRGGGHHSFEDFHSPILDTYGDIRKCSNVFLVAGSGFGGASDTYPYLSGSWSQTYGRTPMPFDGILLGSRMMVAKEAHTARKAKELIVRAPGVPDHEWHHSYEKATGGVVTVISDWGQPIHKLATRAVMLWKDLDNTIFSITDKSKRFSELQKRRTDIIDRLNKDYQRPWFPVNSTGQITDVDSMTYFEVLKRLIFLMYVEDQQRWIDASYRALVADFVTRALERVSTRPVSMRTFDLDKPYLCLNTLAQSYPEIEVEMLHPEDLTYFIGICKRRGQKPVPFIPQLDEDFETWFKKDSLWQAEDLDAVVDQDPQKVCILHGPVAASYSQVADVPSQHILDYIMHSYREQLIQDSSTTFDLEFSDKLDGFQMSRPDEGVDFVIEDSTKKRTYNFPASGSLPDGESFLDNLSKHLSGWAHACIADRTIIRNQKRQPNPIRDALQPCYGFSLSISFDDRNRVDSISVMQKENCRSPPILIFHTFALDNNHLRVTLHAPGVCSDEVSLSFLFCYFPGQAFDRLEDVTENRDLEIKRFYAHLWLGDYPNELQYAGLEDRFLGSPSTITREKVHDFMRATRTASDTQIPENPDTFIPLDICISIAWDALVKPLLISNIKGDLLRLLHTSNEFRHLDSARPLRIGDVLQSTSHIRSVTNSGNGKSIEVCATITRKGTPVVEILTSFLILGEFDDYECTFRRTQEPCFEYDVLSEREQALIMSRDWAHISRRPSDIIGQKLFFELNTQQKYDEKGHINHLLVTGDICVTEYANKQIVGTVYREVSHCNTNPVIDFLSRHGEPVQKTQSLSNSGWDGEQVPPITIPRKSKTYARASGDYNPIHTLKCFTGFAQLPDNVTHGMFTSAAIRRLVEAATAESDPTRFKRFSVSFLNPVHSGDILKTSIQHFAMAQGKMVLKVQVYKEESDVKVLEAEAEVEQHSIAYLFTGQGSQEQGMGMELYESSPAAKKVWDTADRYFWENYGFSIIDIVRNDPKTITIHFGGARGRRIRDNYLDMTIEKAVASGQLIVEPIMQDLTASSKSYTFSDPRGLLYSTQFAQPALTILELAAFEDLKSKGLVQQGSIFAGHSLGEYSALGAMGQVIPLESLVSLVFYRGLTMQLAMDRDEDGKTEFSMVAVNPSRVCKSFDQRTFESVVNLISQETGVLLEIVNYNVRGRQYVCAGHLLALWTMKEVLDSLARDSKLILSNGDELRQLVSKYAFNARKTSKPINLERGVATIPLRGIDVPFHSSYIRHGIDPYRKYLQSKIFEENIDLEKLVDKFVPNVTAKPFSVEKDYVQEAAKIVKSESLYRLLDTWEAHDSPSVMRPEEYVGDRGELYGAA